MTRRRLDIELVRRGLVDSRTAAQAAIEAGHVVLDGRPATKAATLVSDASVLSAEQPEKVYASRAAHKLLAALREFEIDVTDARCLDVGAAHGGFTDVLLEHGAAAVTAVDVGHGQLLWRLRTDPRVSVHERTNIRHADPASLGAPFDIVVADLSFISLCTVAEVLSECGAPSADYLMLVKPQFELGKGRVPRGGVVIDEGDRREAVELVATCFEARGLRRRGVVPSPITGAKGNQEYLLWMSN